MFPHFLPFGITQWGVWGRTEHSGVPGYSIIIRMAVTEEKWLSDLKCVINSIVHSKKDFTRVFPHPVQTDPNGRSALEQSLTRMSIFRSFLNLKR